MFERIRSWGFVDAQRCGQRFLAAVLMVLVSVGTRTDLVWASSKTQDVKAGNKFFKDKKFEDSVKWYREALDKDSNSVQIAYNLGTALYKVKDYQQAVEYLQKALLSEDRSFKGNVYYNLGNALLKFGLSKEDADLEQAITIVEQSVTYYGRGQEIFPRDKDMAYNLEVARKELERLKKKRKSQKGGGESPSPNSEHQAQGQNASSQNTSSQGAPQNSPDAENNTSSGPDQKNPPPTDKNKDGQGQAGQNPPPDQQPPEKKGQDPNDSAPKDEKRNAQGPGTDQHQDPPPSGSPQAGSPQGPLPRAGQAKGDTGQMTPQDARMILEDYEHNEEPKGVLNFIPKTSQVRPVEKDW